MTKTNDEAREIAKRAALVSARWAYKEGDWDFDDDSFKEAVNELEYLIHPDVVNVLSERPPADPGEIARDATNEIAGQFVIRPAAWSGKTPNEIIQGVIQRALDAAAKAAVAERDRDGDPLRRWLRLRHDVSCGTNTARNQCTCGLDAAKERLGI